MKKNNPTKKQMLAKINRNLCGEKLVKCELTYNINTDLHEVVISFTNNHDLIVSLPLGHDFDDVDLGVTNAKGWK